MTPKSDALFIIIERNITGVTKIKIDNRGNVGVNAIMKVDTVTDVHIVKQNVLHMYIIQFAIISNSLQP
jgi:hypothetical protein